MLVGVNIKDSWLTEATSVLRCRVDQVPFMYFGLPICVGCEEVIVLGVVDFSY